MVFHKNKICNHDCMIYFIYRSVPHKHNLQLKTLGSVNNLPHLLPSMTSPRDAIKVGVQLLRASPEGKSFLSIFYLAMGHGVDSQMTRRFMLSDFCSHFSFEHSVLPLQILVLTCLLILWNERLNLSQDTMGMDGVSVKC